MMRLTSLRVMTDFAWIILLNKAPTAGNGGISSNYIIPKNHAPSDLSSLKNGRIWIVVRGQYDRCIALVIPKRVERFSEGYYEGDFLVTTDLKKSLRFTRSYDTGRPYQIDYARNFST